MCNSFQADPLCLSRGPRNKAAPNQEGKYFLVCNSLTWTQEESNSDLCLALSGWATCPCPQNPRTVTAHVAVANVAQSCPILCDPRDCNPPGSSVRGIAQARILACVVIPFSRGSSRPRDQTWVSCFAGRFFIVWVTREALQGLVNLAPHFSVEEPEGDLPRLTPEAGLRAALDSWFPLMPPTRLFYRWFRFNLIPLPGTLIPVRARRPGLPTAPGWGVLETPSSAPLSPCSLWLTHPHRLLFLPHGQLFLELQTTLWNPLVATGACSRSEESSGEQGKQAQWLQGCGGPKYAWTGGFVSPKTWAAQRRKSLLLSLSVPWDHQSELGRPSFLTALTYTLEKTLTSGKTEGQRRRRRQRMRRLDGITDSMDLNLRKLREMLRGREAWRAAIHRVAKSRTQLSDWTTTCFCGLSIHNPPSKWVLWGVIVPQTPFGIWVSLILQQEESKIAGMLLPTVLQWQRHRVWGCCFLSAGGPQVRVGQRKGR